MYSRTISSLRKKREWRGPFPVPSLSPRALSFRSSVENQFYPVHVRGKAEYRQIKVCLTNRLSRQDRNVLPVMPQVHPQVKRRNSLSQRLCNPFGFFTVIHDDRCIQSTRVEAGAHVVFDCHNHMLDRFRITFTTEHTLPLALPSSKLCARILLAELFVLQFQLKQAPNLQIVHDYLLSVEVRKNRHVLQLLRLFSNRSIYV